MKRKHKKYRFLKFLGVIAILFIVFLTIFFFDANLKPPVCKDLSSLEKIRTEIDTNFYVIDNSWLKKNESGLWEMYVEGDPFEIGVISGKLSKELVYQQENAFVEFIYKMVPSKSYLNFLKYFIAWFNRDIDEHVDTEFQKEIYGISQSTSHEFDYISNGYMRLLNYHAAHDIGHALNDLALVACTSFSTWNEKSLDSNLIIGRNFDFYINDDFAKNKLIAFYNPTNGHKFVSITWASMIGVVSGMNETGLTVTINAAKSDIPTTAATPISILAREILQYAGNIEEAIAIAKKRKTFVSESILIGSAADNKSIIIEKSPNEIDTYTQNTSSIVCSNHYQSEIFKDNESNILNIKESASFARQQRCEELITAENQMTPEKAAKILRDRKGMHNKNIGISNEKVMNQMISHHSVIFMPAKNLIWISTPPYQLGKYVAYDLNKIFGNTPGLSEKKEITEHNLTIPADSFLFSKEYENFIKFKKLRDSIKNITSNNQQLNTEFFNEFILLNPEYYNTYLVVADYYMNKEIYNEAIKYYNLALEKDINTVNLRNSITEKLENCILLANGKD